MREKNGEKIPVRVDERIGQGAREAQVWWPARKLVGPNKVHRVQQRPRKHRTRHTQRIGESGVAIQNHVDGVLSRFVWSLLRSAHQERPRLLGLRGCDHNSKNTRLSVRLSHRQRLQHQFCHKSDSVRLHFRENEVRPADFQLVTPSLRLHKVSDVKIKIQ